MEKQEMKTEKIKGEISDIADQGVNELHSGECGPRPYGMTAIVCGSVCKYVGLINGVTQLGLLMDQIGTDAGSEQYIAGICIGAAGYIMGTVMEYLGMNKYKSSHVNKTKNSGK